jgi:hypothetical protein
LPFLFLLWLPLFLLFILVFYVSSSSSFSLFLCFFPNHLFLASLLLLVFICSFLCSSFSFICCPSFSCPLSSIFFLFHLPFLVLFFYNRVAFIFSYSFIFFFNPILFSSLLFFSSSRILSIFTYVFFYSISFYLLVSIHFYPIYASFPSAEKLVVIRCANRQTSTPSGSRKKLNSVSFKSRLLNRKFSHNAERKFKKI